jgi:hypothetical protein
MFFVHAYKNRWGNRNAAWRTLCKAVLESIPDGEWNTEDTVELGESLEGQDVQAERVEVSNARHCFASDWAENRDTSYPEQGQYAQFCQHPEQESVLKVMTSHGRRG